MVIRDGEALCSGSLCMELGQVCKEGQTALRPSSATEEAAGAGSMPRYKLKKLHNWSNLCPIASSPGAFLSAEAQPAVAPSWFQILLPVLTACAGG